MKKFSALVFLFTLVVSSFSQAIFNEIYLADSSNYSLPMRSIETDGENNTYALFAKFDSGFKGYVLKRYSPDGVELASYERPSSTQLWAGEWKPFVYHEKEQQLINTYSYYNDSLVCLERLNTNLELEQNTCFNCGPNSEAGTLDLLNDSLLFLTCTSDEIGKPTEKDAFLMLINIKTNTMVWKRNLGVDSLSEYAPKITVFDNKALVSYRDEKSFSVNAAIYHRQGYPMTQKYFPELNTLFWSKNQRNHNYINAVANVGSIFTNDGVTVLRLNAADLTIEDSATYLADHRAFAGNSFFKDGLLYTPGYTDFRDSSFLLITDAFTGDSLDIKWYNRLGEFNGSNLACIVNLDNGQFILGGHVNDGIVSRICPWLIKTDQYGCASELCLDVVEVVGEENVFQVYPNPTPGNFSIRGIEQRTNFEVFSITGKEMLSGSYQPGSIIDVNPLPPGIYFLRMNNQTEKLVRQ